MSRLEVVIPVNGIKITGTHSGEAQRLYYTAPDSGERMWLDIVPFGGLEREGDREIEWPGGAFRMNVAGFGEALEAAVEVELADDVVVLVRPSRRSRCARSSRGETGTPRMQGTRQICGF